MTLPELLTTAEVARRIGVPEWTVDQAVRRRLVAPPPVVGKTRLWTLEAAERLRAALAERQARRAPRAAEARR